MRICQFYVLVAESGGMAQITERLLTMYNTLARQVITGSISGVPHIFGIVWIFILACVITQRFTQPNVRASVHEG